MTALTSSTLFLPLTTTTTTTSIRYYSSTSKSPISTSSSSSNPNVISSPSNNNFSCYALSSSVTHRTSLRHSRFSHNQPHQCYSPSITNHRQLAHVSILNLSSHHAQEHRQRVSYNAASVCSESAELGNVGILSQSEDFSFDTARINNAKELKVSVKVSGTKTESIYDDVFSKMVAAAQPIPGFRRVKGGKTPNIPKDILLEVLGPSKVYKEVIKKIVNSSITEYVKKEGIKVGTSLSLEQSFEDLEAIFEPGQEFRFDAIIELKESGF